MKSKRGFLSGLVIDGQEVTVIFMVAALATLILRLLFAWPIVIYIVLAYSLGHGGWQLSRWKKKYTYTDVLTIIAASSLVLVIFEYFVFNSIP